MQVSVPGIYQNPAPYREQIFTYSTALAFTGRSAACAPLMARRPAAEPSIRLLTIFMLTSSLSGRSRFHWVRTPKGFGSLVPLKTAQSFRVFEHTRLTRGTKANHLTGRSGPPVAVRNYAFGDKVIKILYLLMYQFAGTVCLLCNRAP